MDKYKTKLIRFKKFVMAVTVASFAVAATMPAEEYSLHFSDPVGDSNPYFDISGMDFSFDALTGAYHARLFTDPAAPFPIDQSSLWFNLVLLNLDRHDAGLGSDLMARFASGAEYQGSTGQLDLFGTDAVLTSWLPGEHVAPGQYPAPPNTGVYPPGNLENTTAVSFHLGIAFQVMDPMGIEQSAVIAVVPEPSVLWLASVGLGGFAIDRRLRSSVRAR